MKNLSLLTLSLLMIAVTPARAESLSRMEETFNNAIGIRHLPYVVDPAPALNPAQVAYVKEVLSTMGRIVGDDDQSKAAMEHLKTLAERSHMTVEFLTAEAVRALETGRLGPVAPIELERPIEFIPAERIEIQPLRIEIERPGIEQNYGR